MKPADSHAIIMMQSNESQINRTARHRKKAEGVEYYEKENIKDQNHRDRIIRRHTFFRIQRMRDDLRFGA